MQLRDQAVHWMKHQLQLISLMAPYLQGIAGTRPDPDYSQSVPKQQLPRFVKNFARRKLKLQRNPYTHTRTWGQGSHFVWPPNRCS